MGGVAVGAVCCEPLSRELACYLNEKFKIERQNEGKGSFLPSFPGFNRMGKSFVSLENWLTTGG
jgi:orotate phosphoribosyltransferase-like protein